MARQVPRSLEQPGRETTAEAAVCRSAKHTSTPPHRVRSEMRNALDATPQGERYVHGSHDDQAGMRLSRTRPPSCVRSSPLRRGDGRYEGGLDWSGRGRVERDSDARVAEGEL